MIYHNGKEYFLDYDKFPWFKNAKISEIVNIETPSKKHFYWPDLDVDLHLESIKHPEKFPLISKED
jgi:hypothetical protein